MSGQGVRIERFGLFKVEQPVGQQWWDNPTPQAESPQNVCTCTGNEECSLCEAENARHLAAWEAA